MKKNMRKAIILALALVMTLTTTAVADTIVSPVFRFPSVQERPTEAPTAEPTAEPMAEPTAEPTEVPTEDPTAAPEVTVEPEVTTEPTEAPTKVPTEEPTAEPTAEPTPEPLPEPVLNVTSNLTGKKIVAVGTELVLTLTVEGAEGYEYLIQWQQSSDGGNTWTDIPGANQHQYSLILEKSHTGLYWRAIIDLLPKNGQ